MFFSLIIPAYNLESYIQDCLSSIHAQSCQDFECIVVDDGSTDGTAGVIERYIVDKPRFRLIRKLNGGVSSARNLGLEHAQGEYVWFIDGDDYIHPDSLSTILGYLQTQPELGYIMFDYNYTHVRYSDCTFPEITSSVKEIYSASTRKGFLRMLNFSPIACCCFCARLSIVSRLKFLPICTGEDRLFALNMVYEASNGIYVEGIQYNVYLRPDSFSRQACTRKIFADAVEGVNRQMAMRGQKDGWGDDVLAFFNERSNFPMLFKKAMSFRDGVDKIWAIQQFMTLLDKHCSVFGNNRPLYVRLTQKSHSTILAWLFFHLRYKLRDVVMQNRILKKLYSILRGQY